MPPVNYDITLRNGGVADATYNVISPGLIDAHSHDDKAVLIGSGRFGEILCAAAACITEGA